MKKNYLLIFLITLLAVFLRLYKLGSVPNGLHRDEAFLGYNAYSLLKTGRDMSGRLFPLHLESFIYSPAGYSYLTTPFIKLFGLSAFSARFASAIFGSLTVLAIYFLVLELFNSKSESLAILSSFLITISPWHLNLSRTATENIVVTFFIIVGTWFFLKKRLFLSFFAFSLTLLFYQASRAFLPLFIPMLILSVKSNLTNIFKSALLYLFLIIIPIGIIITNPILSLRLRTVSIFASQNTQLTIDEFIREDGVANSPRLLTRVFHNKAIGYINQFLQNYFSHFSYNFLFSDDSLPDRYRIAGTGILYLFELPFLLLGFLKLLSKPSRERIILTGWILITPIGSALAFDDIPNLQRTIIMLPALAAVEALGIMQFWKKFKKPLAFGIFISLGIFNVSLYFHQYFTHQPIHKTWYRHEGYQQLVTSVNQLLPGYRKAIITTRETAPTVFFLFYSKYDPATFQQEAARQTLRDFDRINFGKYEFSLEECPLRINSETGLITAKPGVIYVNYGTCTTPQPTRELEAIRRGDQSIIFRIIAF